MSTRYYCPRCNAEIHVGERFCGDCAMPLDPASISAFLAQKSRQEAEQQLHQINAEMLNLRQYVANLLQSPPNQQRDAALYQAQNRLNYLDNQYRQIYYSLYPQGPR